LTITRPVLALNQKKFSEQTVQTHVVFYYSTR
jgi:hypothetical protein